MSTQRSRFILGAPGRPELILALLLLLGASPRLQAGAEDFFLSLPSAPENVDIADLYQQGVTRASTQQWSEALAFFEQIVRQQPQQLEALHMCGICLWQLDQLARAQRFLVLASRHPQPQATTYLALSALHAGATNLLESAGWLRKGLRDLDDAQRVHWIAHPLLQPLWDRNDAAFRSVLTEFALPLDRAVALSRAAETQAVAIPAPHSREHSAPAEVFQTGIRLSETGGAGEDQPSLEPALLKDETERNGLLAAPRLDQTPPDVTEPSPVSPAADPPADE